MWKDIQEWENKYEISDTGQVRNKWTGKILNQFPDKDGYMRVGLNNKRKMQYAVHRLMGIAFLDNGNGYPVINHKDGDKKNNTLDNLEWTTVSANTKHGYDNGLNRMGEEHYACKLTDEQVRFIRNNYKPRDTLFGAKALAHRFGVSLSLISKIGIGLQRKTV